MGFRDDYDFELLINETENLVIEELERQLTGEEYSNICLCQDCILDMATFAMNKLPAKYRSSFTGVIYAQQYHNGEFRKEVENVVKTAINKVSANPSHELSIKK